MENIHRVTSKGFPRGEIPCGNTEFLHYVASVKFGNTPDYKRLKRILEKGIRADFNADGRLPITPPRTPRHNSFSPKKSVLEEIILAKDSTSESCDENTVRKLPPANVSSSGHKTLVRKKNLRSPATTTSASGLRALKLEPERKPVKKKAASAVSDSGFCEGSNSVGLDNPISATLEVLPRKDALLAQQQEGLLLSGGNGRKRSSNSPPANRCPSPLWGARSLSPVQTCDRAVQADIHLQRRKTVRL
ncbi:hypothetical protein HPB50_011156 [Hyalomma asiaticum]|uniref:Uncharacterized protein n=1 Tax=Hyalomma asiaticum TaxID=266040 RepID=A0ACB7TI76_HYAAI|nr:hypothetical protein HPB50_011156 [Hyalomma asiaticum]